jgi:exopolyphosphatase/pppGpp-phosphohydrolase
LDALEAEVKRSFSGLAPPLPRLAVAAGGTARALRRVVGRTLGPKQLAKAEARLSGLSAAEIADAYRLPEWRAQTLLAGMVVLAEAQRRLSVPLVVARAGLREGAVLEVLEAAEAA